MADHRHSQVFTQEEAIELKLAESVHSSAGWRVGWLVASRRYGTKKCVVRVFRLKMVSLSYGAVKPLQTVFVLQTKIKRHNNKFW